MIDSKNTRRYFPMKFNTRKLTAAIACLCLLCSSACAISFTGTVEASGTTEIYAPIGGTVESVSVSAGEQVHTGDVLATLSTTKVYAPEDGTVTGIFGQPGDSAETIGERYGAVMYLETETVYTISASTEDAYNTTANKFVHVGEEVYLCCYSHGTHTGSGVITKIEGADFTVDVTDGEFLVGETVSVFRGEDSSSSNRIGRGDLTRKNPTSVSGSGSIVSFAVSNGDTVKKGDLLFETLKGSFDGLYMSGKDILASCDGTLAQINLSQGGNVEKDSIAAVIYPAGKMRIEAQINEYDLAELAQGDTVNVELLWNQDAEVNYPGVVSMISAIPAESAGAEGGSDDVYYTVYVDFTPDANTRYGMSAVVSTMDEVEAIAE